MPKRDIAALKRKRTEAARRWQQAPPESGDEFREAAEYSALSVEIREAVAFNKGYAAAQADAKKSKRAKKGTR